MFGGGGFGGFGFPGCGWRSVALDLVGMVFWLVFVDLGSFVSGIFRLGGLILERVWMWWVLGVLGRVCFLLVCLID